MITRDSVTEKLKLTTMNSSNLLKFVIATVLSTRVSSDQLMIVFPDDNYVDETDQTYYAYAPPQDSYQQCRYLTFQILLIKIHCRWHRISVSTSTTGESVSVCLSSWAVSISSISCSRVKNRWRSPVNTVQSWWWTEDDQVEDGWRSVFDQVEDGRGKRQDGKPGEQDSRICFIIHQLLPIPIKIRSLTQHQGIINYNIIIDYWHCFSLLS